MFRRKHKIEVTELTTEELSDELRRRGIWCVSAEHNAVETEADARALVALSERWGGTVRELGRAASRTAEAVATGLELLSQNGQLTHRAQSAELDAAVLQLRSDLRDL